VTPRERLLGWPHAFDHPVTVWLVGAIAAVLALAPLLIALLGAAGVVKPELRRELWKRTLTWIALVVLLVPPILLGAAWTIVGVLSLSLFCYQEYARAVGLFREKRLSLGVVIGILLVAFAVLDHWYHFFVALFPLYTGALAVSAILADRPRGYIQRVALAVFAYQIFGCCLGHLGYMANDANYRPQILMVLVCTEMNDVFAFCCGKAIGGPKLAPNTSPNKTVAGSVGAGILTGTLVAVIAHFVWRGTALDTPVRLAGLGLIVAAVGQLGDLMLSSIKRDLGIKDMANVLPGHGGVLDRFNSLLLVAPAVFHYVGFFVGFGLDQQPRIFTGP
jgi:phosphatidate cytidylyltransferase